MVERASLERGQTLRSYAWLLAIIGLLALVGSGVAYFLNRNWVFETQIGAGVGAVLLLGAALLRPDAIKRALTGRSARYGSNALVMSLAFIGILGLLNFLSHKYDQEYDLTETGDFTLSQQTIQILQQLDQPVQVLGFFQAGDPRLSMARDYLERYSHHTGQLSYEFHDPSIEPALARSFELSDYGLVFISGEQRYETAGVDEQSLTSGLIRVTGAQKQIYFVTGHGERSIDDSAEAGYSGVKQALERENYRVASLNLSTITDTVPADTAVLVLAGAQQELFETETQLILGWLAAGGKLMVLADPLQPAPLGQLLQMYGLAWNNDFVVDLTDSMVTMGPDNQLVQQITTPMISQYPFHEITTGLNNFQSFFPFVRSITITPTVDMAAARLVSPILSTSANSWAETNLASTELVYDEGQDWPGPLDIGAAAEDSESGARLVVFGNASFAANQSASAQVANLDLFLNAVNWLAEEEALISIRPQQPTDRQLFLTPLQHGLTLLTTLIIIPLAVFATGVGLWWKRR